MDADREAHVTDAWLQRAVTLLGRGDGSGAVEAMREVLGRDPDDAHAHAILALALVVARRLHAAEHEARLALQLAPDTAIAHRAMGEVCLARRKLAAAQEHLEAARARDPGRSCGAAKAGHSPRSGRPRRPRAPASRGGARAGPDDADTLVAIGNHHLEAGDLARAEEMARAVLAEVAEHQDALVLMGHILLRRGEVGDAWSHARAAAAINPTDTG